MIRSTSFPRQNPESVLGQRRATVVGAEVEAEADGAIRATVDLVLVPATARWIQEFARRRGASVETTLGLVVDWGVEGLRALDAVATSGGSVD